VEVVVSDIDNSSDNAAENAKANAKASGLVEEAPDKIGGAADQVTARVERDPDQ
jgi:hypothetical protein